MTRIMKEWGYEDIYISTDLYTVKHLHLKKGYRCSHHHHKLKDETFYVLSGSVVFFVGDEAKALRTFIPGKSLRIPVGIKHSFAGLTDAVIIEGSTADDADDSYRDDISGRVEV